MTAVLCCAGFPLSGLLFVAAYGLAWHSEGGYHPLYWVATATALATGAGLVRLARHRRRAAAVAVVAVAAVLSLPKFLRAPQYFSFYDELAHWRATRALLDGGHLFAPNVLNRVVADYPGLHTLTATVAAIGGGSVYTAGSLVVLLARLAGGLAAYLLAARILHRPVVALLAAYVFLANPAYSFFDAQYSYESLALPLVTVVLLLAVQPGRWPTLVAASTITAAVVITHHSSSYLLAGLLLLAVLLGRGARRGLLILSGVAAGGALLWLLLAARYTLTYIGPYVHSNLTSIPQFLRGSNAPRKLFAGFPAIPTYERAASFLSVLILFGLYAVGTWRLVRTAAPRQRLDRWLPTLLGCVYFLSLPLVALRGDQVAKRTWEFAFLGLAPAAATGLCRLGRGHRVRLAAVPVLLLIVVIGSGVARSGEHIRFPGPYAASADPRSMTTEVVAAAEWLRGAYGPGGRAVGDRTLAATLGSYGEQDPVTYQEDGQPVWRIFEPDTLTPSVSDVVAAARVRWIAVDLRAAGKFPLTGFYFDESEPGAFLDPHLSWAGLTKFDGGPFRRVYDNGHVLLYEVAS